MLLIEQLLSRRQKVGADRFFYAWGSNAFNQLSPGERLTPFFSWTNVSSFVSHTLAIRSDGGLFAWGSNGSGRLGLGDTTSRSIPTQIGSSSWTALASGTGSGHSAAIRSDGALFTWGYNSFGQLGLGDTTSRSSPVQVGSSSWTSVSVGSRHTTAIRSDGILFTWGNNIYGELGFSEVTNLSSWTAVSAGRSFTVAIRSDGALFTWGVNNFGQLGLGDTTRRLSPVQVGSSSWTAVSAAYGNVLAIRSGGSLFAWGLNTGGQLGLGDATNRSSPVQVGSSNWTAVSIARRCSAAIRSDGALFTWGQNSYGQLGLGDTTVRSSPVQVGTSSWTAVSAGTNFMAAIRSGGSLFTWGRNSTGQLGLNDLTNRSSPVQVGSSNWTAVAADRFSFNVASTLAIRSDGGLFFWGSGYAGRSGLNDNTQRSSPVQIGTSSWTAVSLSYFAMAIRSGGSLFTWGRGAYGATGHGDGNNRSSPVQVGSSNWTVISAGFNHAMEITTSNILFGQGNSLYGQVGTGVSVGSIFSPVSVGNNIITPYVSPVQIGSGTWTSISASFNTTAGIRSGGALFTWGRNNYGQLGLNDTTNRSSPVQVGSSNWTAVSNGLYYMLAIRSGGSLFSWGRNNQGQLGLNDITNRSSPVQVGSSSWTAVAAGAGLSGSAHSLAIRSGGALFGWGRNNYGQLGFSSGGLSVSSPVQIGSSSNWTSVSAGSSFTTALDSNNILYATGRNAYGVLGQGFGSANYGTKSAFTTVGGNAYETYLSPVRGNSSKSWSVISSGYRFTVGIRSDGLLYSWGSERNLFPGGNSGVLGLNGAATSVSVPTQIGSSSWTAVNAGRDHVAAIRSDGALFTWGFNKSGEIGNGTKSGGGGEGEPGVPNVSSPTQIGSSSWTAVACGTGFTMAIRSGGSLFTWGSNAYGQLGNGGPIGYGVNVLSPIQIGSSSWTAIAGSSGGSDNFSAAIRSDGALFTWGYNRQGRLGLNDTTNRSSPVQVGTSSWTAVSLGVSHGMAIRSDGALFGWGPQNWGQLGLGDTTTRSSPVQVGSSSWTAVNSRVTHTLAIRSDGALFAWGRNNYGQLGLNDTTNRSSPVQVGSSSWVAVTTTAGGYNYPSSLGIIF